MIVLANFRKSGVGEDGDNGGGGRAGRGGAGRLTGRRASAGLYGEAEDELAVMVE